ncbi:MAG: hypothetical protein A3G38_04665 [Omnitrophica WOR_2 bacterium RIFCSPLOWO2_12_FULL_51_8]|nr:MAG: hypothetical protein A3G38_04665 [Omnitrophica WOR_2 bacterium RIFCSPLOWO2_12_FULL_51_8]
MDNKIRKIGFTLIELLIAVSISTMIGGALYLSLKSALESWQVSEDRLLLQHVTARLMEELTEGLPDTYGLRDALEITDGSAQMLTVVMPWTDSTHDFSSGIFNYTLNKHIKPGTGAPIAEALLPNAAEYRVIPAGIIDKGKHEEYPEARLSVNLAPGARLRFTFHPDYKRDSDCLTTFRYDGAEKAIFIDDPDGSRNISRNAFGVKIIDFLIRYFDNTNNELGMNGSLSPADIPKISGLELAFKAESKGGNARETVTFVALRNAPMRSGNLILSQGSRFPIPNSNEVTAFSLTNMSGVNNEDELVLDARPSSGGRDWRLKVVFSRAPNSNTPLIEYFQIESPAGSKIYSERVRLPASLGLNLLSLGPNGIYDYGNQGNPGETALTGKVELEVEKMDIAGASVFVRP